MRLIRLRFLFVGLIPVGLISLIVLLSASRQWLGSSDIEIKHVMVGELRLFVGESWTSAQIDYIAEYVSKIKAELTSSLGLDERDSITALGLVSRLELLLSASRRENAETEWRSMVVAYLTQLWEICTDRKESLGGEGMRLFGFRSQIDGNPQHYRAFRPSRSEGKRTPVVIMLPTPTVRRGPFLESTFLDRHLEALKYAEVAQRFGVMVIWSGYHSISNLEDINVEHLREVLADVERRFRIDSERIYLAAVCGSAGLALFIADQMPSRFAGVGLLNASFGPAVRTPSTAFGAVGIREFDKWMEAEDPFRGFFEAGRARLLVYHDGRNPNGHGDWIETERFRIRYRGWSNAFVVRRVFVAGRTNFHMRAWSLMVGDLLKEPNVPSSRDVRRISGATPANLSRLVSSKFVIVKGTAGGDDQDRRIDRVCERIRRNWAEASFGDCRVVTDSCFLRDASEYRDFNILLIGWHEDNAAMHLFKDRLVAAAESLPELQASLHSDMARSFQIVALGEGSRSILGVIGVSRIGGDEAIDDEFFDFANGGWYQFVLFSEKSAFEAEKIGFLR